MTTRSTEPENDTRIAALQGAQTLAGRSAAPVGKSRPIADLVAGPSLISEAIGQLATVVEMTEAATNQIIDACDALTALGGAIGATAEDQITRAVTTILEACGFQDLTGQRIAKVVKSLRLVDGGIGNPTRANLPGPAIDLSANEEPSSPRESERPEIAVNQIVADRLFAQSS
jgi:chemotaxis protein CheZ